MSIRSFHEQPQEIKAEHYVRDEFKGFVYASNNDLLRSKVASWHDNMHAWMSPEAMEAEKIPAVCREEMVEWDRYVTDVGEKVAEPFSEGLGLAAEKVKDEASRFEIMSNGKYRNVEYRVLANSIKEPRILVVEFFSLHKKDEIHHYRPFLELLTAEKPALYRNLSHKEFHDNFFSKGLDSKSFVEKLMIPHE
ncbi:hypothetical protein LOK49_LG05G01011 [Camellia lanceoleosa]|uniref:Uncharacterized protein n=1 Tax=Camellia lanceoleosa TaxID=1840588 RepID=A0ACC0HLH2_9ERIC|nr:hypothetical protein LOK49_LG05G01011 [Camellia lanceoleosa]